MAELLALGQAAQLEDLLRRSLEERKAIEEMLFTNLEEDLLAMFKEEHRLIIELYSKFKQVSNTFRDVVCMLEDLKGSGPKAEEIHVPEQKELTGARLGELLYSRGASSHSYYLQLSQPLELPLFKGKNFSLEVALRDGDGNLTKYMNAKLTVMVFTKDYPPKRIQKNNEGISILKGGTTAELVDGHCSFKKLRLRQVSSHYRNGEVCLVVAASKLQQLIRPLIIEKVVVKAKKMKKLGDA